jgi:poly(3-hydroxybutyrate) depolymerase
VLALLLLSSRRAQAEETLCAGCRLSLPEGTDKVPLVVALHGDYQPVTTMHEAWRRLAVPRGVAVLSIACPTSLGCKGSFWRWDGAPSFILGEVAKVSARRAIDPERLYLVGWSGGGSYIGWRAQELEQSFAAIVIHGGGMPPSSATCSGQKTPVYFLVGDKNPFHALAKNLRDYWKGCESPVTWDLLKGAEHPEEWNALTGHGRKIMDWLLAQKKAAPPPMTEARQLP